MMNTVRVTYTHDHDCQWQGTTIERQYWVQGSTGAYETARVFCAQLHAELTVLDRRTVEL